MAEKIYTVTGMSCAACANAVEKALNKNEDINASVNSGIGWVWVS